MTDPFIYYLNLIELDHFSIQFLINLLTNWEITFEFCNSDLLVAFLNTFTNDFQRMNYFKKSLQD